ncbi:P-loop containing nucleoside triphosphate hydrolase protein [Sodiomyces alkalinus F11]|uniref:P-loop containing nucleoside triphosphate hydrolase protein n=1 Tax=Sodiomyces alkalinus (strain CBS 110278 / VKM F-3762 / F11) TaxID=1314773 RepID=A0A3N2PS04_SODAK|nr:P-loop containing nucleoside triphosphate hydrolase protein [Sodiomyces alkalinus F11]ROT37287.1 P-loop containing nucleoside triphosphate hydrolase protein [Sodiomyces alkalinus F11]
MAGINGVWHKTSVQAVYEQRESYSTTSLAGQKRAYSTEEPPLFSRPSVPAVTRSASLPSGLPRLTASSVTSHGAALDNHPSEYSQRKAIQSTPTSTIDPFLSLSHPTYALSGPLVENLASLGIKSIYPWQKSCLLAPGLLTGEKNLVYSAPTGGGKSLVADVLMLKRVLEEKGAKAILVLPYVALVQEKVRWLRNLAAGLTKCVDSADDDDNKRVWRRRADDNTVRVVGFFGGGKVKATWADFDVGVCTIEKANSLLNTAIDDYSVKDLKIVVLDELHMIDDDHRGYLMELMATKLLTLPQRIQIVGMSATLSIIKLLSSWLGAHSYETRYKPVPIEEHLVYESHVYPAATTSDLLKTVSKLNAALDATQHMNAIKRIESSTHRELKDPVLNAVVALANETARAGYGVLVFAGSRGGCESDARLIARVMPQPDEIDAGLVDKRVDLLVELRSLSTGLDPVLEETIPSGVAFHQAGLTTEERELIATAYDNGVLKVCVATCSLAAGINLPARRVILHNARMGRDFVGPSMLRQMRGRAGRKGKDEIGETFLCCRKNDLEQVVDLMHADLPQISSCLNTDKQRIQRALLEVIAIRLATSRDTIDEYAAKTLLAASGDLGLVRACIETSLDNLLTLGFVTRDSADNYSATQLGKAIVASALDPDDGIFIHQELERALRGFVMDGDMHLLYMFTPVQDFGINVNWRVFRNEMEALDDSGHRVIGFLGIKRAVINRMVHGGAPKESTPEEEQVMRVYRRFYLALQLRDLCNEMPIHVVARKYDVPRGTVQTLSQTCHGFGAGMIKFCEQMGWGIMAAALDHFSDRLRAGARADLLDLAKITFIKSRTARVFWENGFRSVAAVANADPKELIPILMQAQPSKVRIKAQESIKYEDKLLAKAQVISNSANRIWQLQMQQDLEE